MKRIVMLVCVSLCFLFISCSQALIIQTTNPIWVMNTTIELTFYNVDNYEKHYDEVKKIYELYDEIADDYTYHKGNVYDLNTNRQIEASDALIELVNYAIMMQTKTNGYYNPLIGRLSKLWKEAITEEKIITDSFIIANELAIMNESKLIINGNQIKLEGEANLDLGGIAKGFATNKAKEYLDKENVNSFLLNAGQSNVVIGTKHNENFKVSLDAPYSYESILQFRASNLCIASSSGKYQNILIDGVRYHHLLSPFTGKPATTYDSVNVICKDSGMGDAFSTAIFMMDMATALEFAFENKIDILLYKDSSILYQSEGWAKYA